MFLLDWVCGDHTGGFWNHSWAFWVLEDLYFSPALSTAWLSISAPCQSSHLEGRGRVPGFCAMLSALSQSYETLLK